MFVLLLLLLGYEATARMTCDMDQMVAMVAAVPWWSPHCNETMRQTARLSSLPVARQDAIMHCIVAEFWRGHEATPRSALTNSTCDVLVATLLNQTWRELDLGSRLALRECLENRLVTEAMRQMLGRLWIPRDLLTHPLRKWAFGVELVRALLICAQYECDQRAGSEVASVDYQALWAQLGLRADIYGKPDLTLRDYFTLNDAPYDEGMVSDLRALVRSTVLGVLTHHLPMWFKILEKADSTFGKLLKE